MPARRTFPALMSWFVSLAILLGAIAPAVSQAMRAEASTAWADICTVTGATSERRGDPQAPAPAESARPGGKHCPWCAPPDVPPGLPGLGAVFEARLQSGRLPVSAAMRPLARASWVRAPARAPPLAS